MLELKNIIKDYTAGDTTVSALKGVSISFGKSEFVSVLGPSGCGKTTLLNIIGGLDRYTSGDLIINGVSTKEYTDRDWDAYRNHSVGFVFQSYNLIPHQSVLSNVELALTLSGVSKAERKKRAVKALERVGLGDQIKKKPNQMSGGQMQRVAIARALVNDPDILLADEPTGALDSATSVQVMEILKEVSKDRLVIMVTHN
ncbi:MAG TPA: ABC transporter ATP-binding protein, partial [Bacillota bacterium]|nr:ABC transporter ATP-binding protein [Bacillota bacterium]